MRFGGARYLLAATLLGVVLLPACTPEQGVDDEATESVSEQEAPTAAGDLRLELEQGFGLHAHLLIEASRRGEGAQEALERNTTALAGVVGEAYDDEAASDFGDAAGVYARALSDDPDAIGDAQELFAETLSDVTGATMDRDGTIELVAAATDSLVEAIAAGEAREHDDSYAARREAYADMLDLGRAFAAGITEDQPDDYPGLRSSGVLELRSALRQLLGEHALLAVTLTRRGAAGAPDFPAAAAALNGNTEDLVRALRATYGTDVASFDRAWRKRIEALADYTVAAAAPDDKALAAARAALRRSDAEVAEALETLTDTTLPADGVLPDLERCSAALVRQVDAWVKQREAPADRELERAYTPAAEVATIVADGIAAHRPQDFPER